MESNSNDITWGKLLTCGEKPVFIGSLYRNPSSTIEQLEKLESSLSNIVTGQSLPLIILGGNAILPDIDWKLSTPKPNPQYGQTLNQKFLDIVDNFYLNQHVHEPTRLN